MRDRNITFATAVRSAAGASVIKCCYAASLCSPTLPASNVTSGHPAYSQPKAELVCLLSNNDFAARHRDLSNIAGLMDTPRLLALLASRSAALLNISELSRSFGIPHTTLQRYLALFEAAFLIHRIPAWTANIRKRLVKTPKALLGDTGFMAHLLNSSENAVLTNTHLSGRFLETFVGCELLKQIEWEEHRPALMHYRRAAGQEVDYVLEEGSGRVAGSGSGRVFLFRTATNQDSRC